MNKIEEDGGNLTLRIESLPYKLLSLFIYALLILLCYCIEIFYMRSLYWRYGPCILAPLHSMGLCRKHAVAGVDRLGFNLLRANSCSCLFIHLFFLARNSSEKQEACQKRNHPFGKAPAICRVEVSKAKLCLFSIMWASGTVPKPCWGSSVKKKNHPRYCPLTRTDVLKRDDSYCYLGWHIRDYTGYIKYEL